MKFGSYDIERKIAIGGMAEIYKATNDTGLEVAIKKIHPDLASQEKFIQMFLDEVRIVMQLEHPNIVQLLDFGLVDGAYYYAMEWVDGQTLTGLVQEQRKIKHFMPVDVCLHMMIDLSEGLAYAHHKKDRYGHSYHIVHRDVSPPNILIGAEAIFKITDFGIAQVKDKNLLTQPGIIRGKFSYMSPEQSLGKKLDCRSDLFSLGVVMFEALTNSSLFLKSNEVKTLEAVRAGKVPPLAQFRNDVPPPVEKLMQRALHLDRDKRFSSGEDIALEAKKILRQLFPYSSRTEVVAYLKDIFPRQNYREETVFGMSSDDYHRRASVKLHPSFMNYTDERMIELARKGVAKPVLMSIAMAVVTILLTEFILAFVSLF